VKKFFSFAIKVGASHHGINQLDFMLFGFCFYGRIPNFIRRKIHFIHFACGVWGGGFVLIDSTPYKFALLIKP